MRVSLCSPPLLLTALCALATSASAQQLLQRDVDVNGVTRDYMVYLPAGYDGVQELPIMFVFHGGSMDPISMLQYVDMRTIADAEGFIPVYPAGLFDNDGDRIWNSEGPYTNGTDEIGFTSAMIDAMSIEFAIDTDRVYACGYSNGANLAWELAALLSDRVTAVGAVAGSMWTWTPPLATAARPVPVVSIHGTWDFYNPWGGNSFSLGLVDASEYWVQHNNATPVPTIVDLPNIVQNDGSTVQRYHWSDGDNFVDVEHYKVIRGGHDWPGVGSGPKAGNQDINATEVIWEFCSQFDLSGRIGARMTLATPGAVVAGSAADFTVANAAPAELTYLAYGLQLGTTWVPPLGVALNLSSAMEAAPATTSDAQGSASWTVSVPPAAAGFTVYLQACQLERASTVLLVQVQ